MALDNKDIQIEVLQSLIDMLRCPELAESFTHYAELLVLKVIRAHKFDDKGSDSSNGSSNSRTTVKYLEVFWCCLFVYRAIFIIWVGKHKFDAIFVNLFISIIIMF